MSTSEKVFKQRLEGVLATVRDKVDEHVKLANIDRGGSYAAIYDMGASFVVEMIRREFSMYCKPIDYIDDDHSLFVDAVGDFYFWDELRLNALGPYGGKSEVIYAMGKYGASLDVAEEDEAGEF